MDLINEDPAEASTPEPESAIWALATDLEFEISEYAKQLRELADLIEELSRLPRRKIGMTTRSSYPTAKQENGHRSIHSPRPSSFSLWPIVVRYWESSFCVCRET